MNPENGRLIKIKNLYDKQESLKFAISLEDGLKLSSNPIKNVYYNGRKSVWEITTKSGRKIKATANHPFLTPDGWQLLQNLKIKNKIAVPRVLPELIKPLKNIGQHKLALLGYLLAERNLCHPHGFYFYSKNEEEIMDYLSCLKSFENTTGKIDRNKSTVAVYAKRKNVKKPSEAVEWINFLGLKYKKATQKFFPDFVFQLLNKDLAILIGKMFQGDGCINLKREHPQIFYATSSSEIASNFQHLLLRFGIISSIHNKKFKYRDGIKIGYTVSINRYENINKFINYFGEYFVGEKKRVAQKIIATHPILNGAIPPWSARGSCDIIPVRLVKNLMRETVLAQELNFRQFERKYGISWRLFMNDREKIGYLRETIGVIGEKLENEELLKYAYSDIYWDGVKNIEFKGIEKTYDLTINKNHNFIANDIIVHNSHAACYALIGYQTAYLKTHYPIEFMTGLLNADSGDTERIAFLIHEAQRAGIKILPPDINKSFTNFIPEDGNDIRFGLLAIKNVGANIIDAIIQERQVGGPFTDFINFLTRVFHKDLNKKSLESLLKTGAFDFLNVDRGQLLTNIEEILAFSQNIKKNRDGNNQNSQNSLFGADYSVPAFLKINGKNNPISNKEKLAWEKELLGLYISGHPLDQYLGKINGDNIKTIKKILENKGFNGNGNGSRTIGVISKIKRITTKTGQSILFVEIEDKNNSLEMVVFSDTLAKNPAIWQENKVILASGKLSWRNNEPKFICQQATEL